MRLRNVQLHFISFNCEPIAIKCNRITILYRLFTLLISLDLFVKNVDKLPCNVVDCIRCLVVVSRQFPSIPIALQLAASLVVVVCWCRLHRDSSLVWFSTSTSGRLRSAPHVCLKTLRRKDTTSNNQPHC